MAGKLTVTPSQTVGPFRPVERQMEERADLASGSPVGERIVVEGQVTDGDGAAVADACLELWQANAAGRYAHPDDTRTDAALDPNFRGFGRVSTGADGGFRFTTIRPGAVPGRGNALQAPHIAVAIFARGLLKQLYTRIYFAGENANDSDPVLQSIDDPAVRRTLIATRHDGPGPPTYRFDIVLQGARETAFFEF